MSQENNVSSPTVSSTCDDLETTLNELLIKNGDLATEDLNQRLTVLFKQITQQNFNNNAALHNLKLFLILVAETENRCFMTIKRIISSVELSMTAPTILKHKNKLDENQKVVEKLLISRNLQNAPAAFALLQREQQLYYILKLQNDRNGKIELSSDRMTKSGFSLYTIIMCLGQDIDLCFKKMDIGRPLTVLENTDPKLFSIIIRESYNNLDRKRFEALLNLPLKLDFERIIPRISYQTPITRLIRTFLETNFSSTKLATQFLTQTSRKRSIERRRRF